MQSADERKKHDRHRERRPRTTTKSRTKRRARTVNRAADRELTVNRRQRTSRKYHYHYYEPNWQWYQPLLLSPTIPAYADPRYNMYPLYDDGVELIESVQPSIMPPAMQQHHPTQQPTQKTDRSVNMTNLAVVAGLLGVGYVVGKYLSQ